MRRLAIALTVTLAATAAFAHEGDHRSSAEECSERNIRFGDEPTFVKKEVINASSLRSIKAAVTNAPISFEGGNSAGYTITVCKAATSQALLDQIRVSLNGNELEADGPENGARKQRWTVMYHIRAPRGADIDVDAENGPISFRDINGKVVARAQNGPLALSNVEGDIDATTNNGPISVDGGSGTMKVKASNGPLTVDLGGSSWNGTLDASTKNGPLTVRVPRNFNSGVVIEAKGHGPISCRAADCERGWRSDDDGEPRRIELGNGPATVHLSTVNGPVTVRDGE